MLPRREFLAVCAAAAVCGTARPRARAATPASDELAEHDLILEGDAKLARRALVLVPTARAPDHGWPVLVLLHGLGETGNELLGIHAWGERYGLVRAYERLLRPPVSRREPRRPYLSPNRAVELNHSLAQRPFRGLIVVCPVTPNPHRHPSATHALDRYADWVDQVLLPAVSRVAPSAAGAERRGLDGCSLGGYVGVELFLRKPELFASFGMVQGAIGVAGASAYAQRLARAVDRVGPRAFHFESSSEDPYRRANQTLSRELLARGVPHQLRIPPGPHNQPWLQEIGTIEMLLWHERQLSAR